MMFRGGSCFVVVRSGLCFVVVHDDSVSGFMVVRGFMVVCEWFVVVFL